MLDQDLDSDAIEIQRRIIIIKGAMEEEIEMRMKDKIIRWNIIKKKVLSDMVTCVLLFFFFFHIFIPKHTRFGGEPSTVVYISFYVFFFFADSTVEQFTYITLHETAKHVS